MVTGREQAQCGWWARESGTDPVTGVVVGQVQLVPSLRHQIRNQADICPRPALQALPGSTVLGHGFTSSVETYIFQTR